MACSALGGGAPDEPRQYLDEGTAATVTAVERPLVFARERTEYAANARDYVTLAAAAVNRSGRIRYVLVAYCWSTVDSRISQEPPPVPHALVIVADDRSILLTDPVSSTADVGLALPVGAPAGPGHAPYVFTTDLATLRFLAAARHLAVQLGSDAAPTYQIWNDGRPALQAWVEVLTGAR